MQIYESYVCDICGKEFEDKDECQKHELFCEIRALEKENSMKIIVFNDYGLPETVDEDLKIEDVRAIYVSGMDAIRMIKNWFEWMGYCDPWDVNWRSEDIKEKAGLLVYDKSKQEWYYPEDVIKETQEILEKYKVEG